MRNPAPGEGGGSKGKEGGYFCTTSGNVTDDVILQYIENHGVEPHMRVSTSSDDYLSILGLLVR